MIFRGRHYRTGQLTDVRAEKGVITAVAPAGDDEPDHGGPSFILSPGMVDVQINGFGGKDFLSPDITVEDVAFISRRVLDTGVTRYCPTLISNTRKAMVHQAATIAKACEADELTAQMVLGLHVEGPFLCPEDGPRGAHGRQYIRLPNWDEFSELYEAADGKVRMVTLAPEQPGAISLIEKLVERNVIPALGHHQADRAALDAAIDAGARTCTHLGNGCHATMHRLANYVWEQLGEDRLWASFIPDGHHIPPSTLRCMLRAKGPSRSILTTDAVACAGLPPGDYELLGQPVTLHPDGRMCLTGTPYFAGSAVTMPAGIGIVVKRTDLSLADVLDLVVRQPFRLFGQANAEDRLAPGQPTDLILFTWDEPACQMTIKLAALGDEVVGRA